MNTPATMSAREVKKLQNMIPVIIAAGVVIGALKHFLGASARTSLLWIISPSGQTTIALPFYTALRVIRKHGWYLAKVEPVRKISRWQALKILVGSNA